MARALRITPYLLLLISYLSGRAQDPSLHLLLVAGTAPSPFGEGWGEASVGVGLVPDRADAEGAVLIPLLVGFFLSS